MERQMTIAEQVEYLMQGTDYGDETLKTAMTGELQERLAQANQEGRPLRVYCGYDPRTTDLHLGHTVTLRKLRQFQELGHEVTFLVGSYTSLIGDPSDKDKLRPILTPEEVERNARTYAEQAYRILDPEITLIKYNGDWLSKLTFAQLIQLASNFTIQQFLTRENFKLRWDKGEAIYLHETFYTLMQGYDAYSMRSDVQIGGTDQLFNIITAARKIMTTLGEKPNIGVILSILPGTDGVVKMSKSLGNHIPINTTPEDMYGKVMSIPDFVMGKYARLVTRWTPPIIHEWEQSIQSGSLHPRDAKMKLAREITGSFYGDKAADEAQQAFVRTFQQREAPQEMPEFHLVGSPTVLEVLVGAGMVASKAEGRRLIEQHGVRLDGEIITNPTGAFPHPGILQIGKRRFLKVLPG